MNRFDGKTIIVTGAGSGIGEASASRFATEGGSVVVVDLDLGAAERTAAAIGRDALAVGADISDPGSVAEMMRVAIDAFGTIDVLHANAGIGQPITALEDTTLQDWRRIMDVNLTGTFLTVQAVTQAMKTTGGGSIVVTSSVSSLRPRPGMAAYITSKAALNGFVRALALELASIPIRVNAVLPAAARTPMLAAMSYGDDVEASIATMGESLPLGRVLDPSDLAAAVAYLASDEAANVTGVLLNVDGGRNL